MSEYDTCPDYSNHPCDCGIPTDAERAANRKAIMALTKQERFDLLFGHPRTLMNDTPTPRTDAEVNNRPRTIQQFMGDSLRDALVPSDFARTLERELTAAREELKKAEWTKIFAIEQAKELKAVTEQRDRLVKLADKWRKSKFSGEYGIAVRHCLADFDEAIQSLNQNADGDKPKD